MAKKKKSSAKSKRKAPVNKAKKSVARKKEGAKKAHRKAKASRIKKRKSEASKLLSEITIPKISPNEILRKRRLSENESLVKKEVVSQHLPQEKDSSPKKEFIPPPKKEFHLPQKEIPYQKGIKHSKKNKVPFYNRILGDEFLAISGVLIFAAFMKLGYGYVGSALGLLFIAAVTFICGVKIKLHIKNQY